jgi:hypothetical protein
VQKLILSRNQKRAEFSRIKDQFEPSHPTYQSYEGDLRGLEDEVKLVAVAIGESIENGYNRAVEHERTLRQTVQEQKLTLIEVDGIMKEFRTLHRAVEAASGTYERLLDRINDTEVTEAVDETVVRTFSEPLVPDEAGLAEERRSRSRPRACSGRCSALPSSSRSACSTAPCTAGSRSNRPSVSRCSPRCRVPSTRIAISVNPSSSHAIPRRS